MCVFKEHSLIGDKTPEETHSGEGASVGVDSFVLIIRVCVSWNNAGPEAGGRSIARHNEREWITMKVADMRAYRKVLEQLRSRLRGDVNTMADAALGTNTDEPSGHSSTMPVHMADIGSDAFEQEFTLTLMENEEDTLHLVEEALARIRQKKFGTCVECGGIITKKRLEALPYAPTCIRCAEILEHNQSFQPRLPR